MIWYDVELCGMITRYVSLGREDGNTKIGIAGRRLDSGGKLGNRGAQQPSLDVTVVLLHPTPSLAPAALSTLNPQNRYISTSRLVNDTIPMLTLVIQLWVACPCTLCCATPSQSNPCHSILHWVALPSPGHAAESKQKFVGTKIAKPHSSRTASHHNLHLLAKTLD